MALIKYVNTKADLLSFDQVLKLQSYLEGAARIVIYVYTLLVALFALAGFKNFFEILGTTWCYFVLLGTTPSA